MGKDVLEYFLSKKHFLKNNLVQHVTLYIIVVLDNYNSIKSLKWFKQDLFDLHKRVD